MSGGTPAAADAVTETVRVQPDGDHRHAYSDVWLGKTGDGRAKQAGVVGGVDDRLERRYQRSGHIRLANAGYR